MTRKEQAAKTREILFNAAMDLLGTKPFEEITVRDIVSKAGVSIGTFYNYYSSKLDVFYETYILADEFFESTVRQELETISDGEEKVFLFFDYYARYSSEITNLSLTRILYNTDNKYFDRNVSWGMHPLLISIIKYGQENKTFRNDIPSENISKFLLISVRGQVYDWCTHDGSYNLRAAVKEQVKLLLESINYKRA